MEEELLELFNPVYDEIRLDKVKELLAKGANPNFINSQGDNVLRLSLDRPEFFQVLINFKGDINLEIEGIPLVHHLLYDRGDPYISESDRKRLEEVLMLLLENNVELNHVDTRGNTALDIIISNKPPYEIQDMLLDKGAIAVKNKRLFESNRYQKKRMERLQKR